MEFLFEIGERALAEGVELVRGVAQLDGETVLGGADAMDRLAVARGHTDHEKPFGHARARLEQRLAQIIGAAAQADLCQLGPVTRSLAANDVAGCGRALRIIQASSLR